MTMNTLAAQPVPQPASESVTMTELLSAFFVTGMHSHDVGIVLAKWENGHVELVHNLLTYAAPLAQMMCAAVLCVPEGGSGGFLYEVAEPFGSWFAETVLRTGTVPEHEHAIAKLQGLVIDFYLQDEECDSAKLAAAVSGARGLHVLH